MGWVSILLWIGPGYALADAQVRTVTVDASDPVLRTDLERFFSDGLKPGISADRISALLKEAYLRWPVYTLAVYESRDAEGIDLRISAEIRAVVIEINVSGSNGIDKQDVIEHLGFTVGERVDPNELEKGRASVQKYYQSRGFPKAEVKLAVEAVDQGQKAKIQIQVIEGEPCRLDKVEVAVSGDVPEKDIRGWLEVAEGDRCDLERVREGQDRIERELRSRDFKGVQISDPRLEISEDTKAGRLSLQVESGPRISVVFLGNTYSFERNSLLEKAIELGEEKQFSDSWKESVAKEGILQFYRLQGYPHAKVSIQDSLDGIHHRRWIRFVIDRGAKVRLIGLEFEGNQLIGTQDLEEHFWSTALEHTHEHEYVADELIRMPDSLMAFYQSKGFLRCRVSDPMVTLAEGTTRVKVKFKIEEGKPSIVKTLKVEGNQSLTLEEVEGTLKISERDPIDPLAFQQAADRLEERYRRLGYKYVKVTLPPLEQIAEGAVEYRVGISEGAKISVGEIAIRGNLHTNENVIRRELKIEQGDRYNPDKFRESQRNLLRTGFFESATLDEVPSQTEPGVENVVISIRERKKRSLRLRPGFSTDDGARGAVDFSYVNIAGTGRSASIGARVNRQIHNADILEHRITLSYREPKFLGIADGAIHLIDERNEEQQFDIDRRSIILGLERDLLSWLRGTVQWELEFRDPFNEQPGAVLSPFDQSSARFGSIATILDIDRRNDALNATRGSFHRIKFDLYNQNLLSEADFYQAYVRNTFFVPVYKGIRIVAGLRFGFSGTYGQTQQDGIPEIPIEKRFRLGGNMSLRGFNRNCIGGLPSGAPENCSDLALSQAPGGNSVFNYMVDLLLPLSKGFDFAIFTDGGNAFLANGDFSLTDIRTSAGVGLRYNTYFGPIRLDDGVVLDRRSGEAFGEIHFAVGQF